MKLRDHPLMTYRGIKTWPPIWVERFGDGNTAAGEIGTLKHVAAHPKTFRRCYLYITYDSKPYVGSLLFDDLAFGRLICDLLKCKIGQEIAQIGDLDFSDTL